MASPSAPFSSASLGVATELIDSLQGELARLPGSSAIGSGANGDELMFELPQNTRLEAGGSMQFLVQGASGGTDRERFCWRPGPGLLLSSV